MADMVCRFEPDDGGDPTYAGGVATIQVGQRVLLPPVRWQPQAESSPEVAPWP